MATLANRTHKIDLTAEEEQLFDVLRACAESLHQRNPGAAPVELRVAGGWVRDKLLGKESDDIDIAIDTMKGEPFAHAVNHYMQEQGLQMGHIAAIMSNPDKSKHLETANARVFNYLVDFVHLRTETYNEDSRNPEVEFGTPLEDALRRDITINALFYNLRTREIEDFTGNGLDDLAHGFIRTPLPAAQTFMDDPLRILRVIRFATRFGYTIDEDIITAVRDEYVKDAFKRKITRERIGVELLKMIKGPNPVRALKIIDDIGYYPLVWETPADMCVPIPPGLVVRYAETVASMIGSQSLQEMLRPFTRIQCDADDKKILYLASSVVPFRGYVVSNPKRDSPLSREVGLTAIKLSLFDAEASSKLVDVVDSVRKMVADNSQTAEGIDRRTLGMFIRELGTKPLFAKWYLTILFGWVSEIVESASTAGQSFDDPAFRDISKKYIKFMHDIRRLGLEDVQDFRAHLNGKEITAMLGMKKPGPAIGEYISKLVEWQLGHPEASKEECTQWVAAYAQEHPPHSIQPPPTKKLKSG
ncbi:uncharacterized protein EV422DRAFT_601471 [Fimicolochytrium jonesii]|uniref:uncharacterized protein n=1 Tax=Fimicolochytrium jonesii TaxID=1396493 RepID=UPI0022FE2235|nr:uncharacterized protein EV422DRAFT_601471 [Fimicolochytrium jonesii]KAI8818714.1 hypothetical protein EV422DRAFT_601471 [Fimicolochytrium jonesii]